MAPAVILSVLPGHKVTDEDVSCSQAERGERNERDEDDPLHPAASVVVQNKPDCCFSVLSFSEVAAAAIFASRLI